MFSLL